jgi:hypothetical protein
MPGEFSSTGATDALDAVTGRVTQTARSTYIALLTAAPDDDTTLAAMAEVSAGGYARQQITWTAPADNAGAMRTQNDATVTFGPFSTNPAEVTHAALVSATSGTSGDFLMLWTLDVAKDAEIDESIQILAGDLSMDLD